MPDITSEGLHHVGQSEQTHRDRKAKDHLARRRRDRHRPLPRSASWRLRLDRDGRAQDLGVYPIVTSQYSSTTLYQVFYRIQ